jgi:hypothetical protein
MELCSSQFRCMGRCGKDWRTIWERTFEPHPNTARRQSSATSQVPAMTARTRTEGLGIPVAFKMISKPHAKCNRGDAQLARAKISE